MEVETPVFSSRMKIEPHIIECFEIHSAAEPIVVPEVVAVNGSQESFVPLSDSSPNASTSSPPFRWDPSTYQPGVALNLPLAVITSLKAYLHRLERASGRYVCIAALNSCLDSFSDFSDFCLHLRTSHSACKRYRCPYCGQSVSFDKTKQHIDSHFEEPMNVLSRYPCPYCAQRVPGVRRRDLAAHMERHHKPSLLKYPYCGGCTRFFSDVHDYCDHIDEHAFNLFHCPHAQCLVKSPDKMLVVEHYHRQHRGPDNLSVHFRVSRHSSCASKVELEALRPISCPRSDYDQPCAQSPQKQDVLVLHLECPVCGGYPSGALHKFMLHVARCKRYANGEEVELCPDESEVQLDFFSCSSCDALATKKSVLQLHLRSGVCRGVESRILTETVMVERLGSPVAIRRRPPRSVPPPLPSPSAPVVPSSPNWEVASASTEGTVPCMKEEPIELCLVGSAAVAVDVMELMLDPMMMASQTTYSALMTLASDLGKLTIGVFATPSGQVIACPRCSGHFPAEGTLDGSSAFGHHFVGHFGFNAEVTEKCRERLKVTITLSPPGSVAGSAPMVIKDEALPTPEVVAAPTVSSHSEHNESSVLQLVISQPVVERVVRMLPNASEAADFRDSLARYSQQRVLVERNRYVCEHCPTHSVTSFSEIRKHILRKHCRVRENHLMYCHLVIRQQLVGLYELLPDDLQMRILDSRTVLQNQINYRVSNFVKQRKNGVPSIQEVRLLVERLLEKMPTSSPKSAPGKKASGGKLMPSEPLNADLEVQSPRSDRTAYVKFDEERFNALASVFNLDTTMQSSVRRKMELLKTARISCSGEGGENHVVFSCCCGEYRESVQSRKVTDGPRRHALRAHVRISKVHWSLCLQSTVLVFDSQANSPRKRPPNEEEPSEKIPAAKRARVESVCSENVTAPPESEGGSPCSLTVCGYKMRAVDTRRPLAHLEGLTMEEAEALGYCGFSIITVRWSALVEARQTLQDDANAEELRARLARLREYRVYALEAGSSRSHLCSACGFASDYSSRDVRRHLLVLHLGVNVELVTGILNCSDNKSFDMTRHTSPVSDLLPCDPEERTKKPPAEKPPAEKPPAEKPARFFCENLDAIFNEVVGSEDKRLPDEVAVPKEAKSSHASGVAHPSSRKKLRPMLPAFAKRTPKSRVQKSPPPEPVPDVQPETQPLVLDPSRSFNIEAVLKDPRFQPIIRLKLLLAQDLPEGCRVPLAVLRVKRNSQPHVFRCSSCGQEGGSKSEITAHITRVHLKQAWRFGCAVCGKKFAGMSMFKAHMNAHHEGVPMMPNRIINKERESTFEEIDVEEA